ncbi:MAG: HD domain-containing phosphohydrolase [Thermodesulfobacteriota bacterium]
MERITTIENEITKLKAQADETDWHNQRIQGTLTDCANNLFSLIGGESCHFHLSIAKGAPIDYEFSVNRRLHGRAAAPGEGGLTNKVISSFLGKDKEHSTGWVRLTYNEANGRSFSSFDKKRLADLAYMIGMVIQESLASYREIVKADCNQLAMIVSFMRVLEAKSKWTLGHSAKVANVGIALLDAALGNEEWVSTIDQEEIDRLEHWFKFGALLHDIGKVGVNDSILDKSGKLTADEFDKMKIHAGVGGSLLDVLGSECAKSIIPIIKHHHENYDGSGYPEGLKGIDIPSGARILKVSDVFCALTEDRPYRGTFSLSVTINEIKSHKGKMFDPILVDIFSQLPLEEFIKENAQHDAEMKAQLEVAETKAGPEEEKEDKANNG